MNRMRRQRQAERLAKQKEEALKNEVTIALGEGVFVIAPRTKAHLYDPELRSVGKVSGKETVKVGGDHSPFQDSPRGRHERPHHVGPRGRR